MKFIRISRNGSDLIINLSEIKCFTLLKLNNENGDFFYDVWVCRDKSDIEDFCITQEDYLSLINFFNDESKMVTLCDIEDLCEKL